MNSTFASYVERTKLLFIQMERCIPVAFTGDIPPKPGVYLFLEGEAVERVGRSNNLRNRLRNHLRADHNSGTYAFKRAREKLGLSATYKKESSRKILQSEPAFMELFRAEIARLRTLNVKYVVVENSVEQYLLELYAAIEHRLPLDEFENH